MKGKIGTMEIRISWWQLVLICLINIPVKMMGKKAIQPKWLYKVVGPK